MFGPGRLDNNNDNGWEANGQENERESMSQLSKRPYSAMPQQAHHQRTMTEEVRRPRPAPIPSHVRSNTAESNDFPLSFRAPLGTREAESSPYDRCSTSISLHSRNERPGSLGRTLKSKASKLLGRQGNDGNLTSLGTVNWSQKFDDLPYEAGPSLSPQRNIRETIRSSASNVSTVRGNISEPFNFKHLTHTEHNQFVKMQQASHDELVSEFSVIRASQAPRQELHGIKAESLWRHDLPFETSPPIPQSPHPLHSSYNSTTSTPLRPSDGSPKLSAVSASLIMSHQSMTPSDMLQQLTLQPRQERELQYISPRYSIPQDKPTNMSIHQSNTRFLAEKAYTEAKVAVEDSAACDVSIAKINGEAYDFSMPHAITTPDDAAHVLRPPPFELVRTELSKVIEEDEHSEARRNLTTTTMKHPSTADSSLRHVKSFPSTRPSLERSRESSTELYRENIQSSPRKQRRSIKILQPSFDDAIGDVPFTRRSRRFSATIKDAEGNWEDLVDWCYEHNAEADCNFDFTRAMSLTQKAEQDSPSIPHDTPPAPRSLDRESYADPSNAPRSSSVYSASPPALLSLQTSLSALEPPSAASAHSSFDSVSEAVTPALSAIDLPQQEFTLSESRLHFSKSLGNHSPHVSTELTSQEIYEDLCREIYARDSYHCGRVDGSIISSASTRSSRSPISKSSSQESFWVRRHKCNSSVISLPDLVASRISREKAEAFPDYSTDQMVALNTSEEQQPPAACRRIPGSLVKDVAQKNLLSRLQSGGVDDATNAEVPLPVHPALRNRAGSDAAFRDPEVFGTPFVRPPAIRKRSSCSAVSLKGVNISPSASVASCGLYSKNTVR